MEKTAHHIKHDENACCFLTSSIRSTGQLSVVVERGKGYVCSWKRGTCVLLKEREQQKCADRQSEVL